MEIKGLAADIDAHLLALPSRKTEIVRAMRRVFSKRLANAHAGVVIGLSLELLERPNFEYRFLAYELVCHHPAALRSLGERELEQLGHGIDSWQAPDTSASERS